MERLKEARNSFLNDVLQPEIIRISKDLGFRAYPTAKFTEIDLKDETQYMRTISRLMELSILTPEQGIEAIQTENYDEDLHEVISVVETGEKKILDVVSKGYSINGNPFRYPKIILSK